MDLTEAANLARSEMNRHNLQDWEFDMNCQMKTAFGRCDIRKKVISLSAILTHLNPLGQVLDTIHHEIAHALREIERYNIGPSARHLTASVWHDPRWSQIAKTLGSDGKQFYSQRTVNTGRVPVKNAWKMTCPNCSASGTTMRKSKKACCARCVQQTGQYYHWIYTPNK